MICVISQVANIPYWLSAGTKSPFCSRAARPYKKAGGARLICCIPSGLLSLFAKMYAESTIIIFSWNLRWRKEMASGKCSRIMKIRNCSETPLRVVQLVSWSIARKPANFCVGVHNKTAGPRDYNWHHGGDCRLVIYRSKVINISGPFSVGVCKDCNLRWKVYSDVQD